MQPTVLLLIQFTLLCSFATVKCDPPALDYTYLTYIRAYQGDYTVQVNPDGSEVLFYSYYAQRP